MPLVARVSGLAAVLLALSCGHTELRPLVAHRAAADLACAENELVISELHGDVHGSMVGSVTRKTFAVDGCGKRATYDAWCASSMLGSDDCDAAPARSGGR